MTDRPEEKRRLENLELNRETLQDLTEGEGEQGKGGARGAPVAEGGSLWSRCGGATCPGWECPLQ